MSLLDKWAVSTDKPKCKSSDCEVKSPSTNPHLETSNILKTSSALNCDNKYLKNLGKRNISPSTTTLSTTQLQYDLPVINTSNRYLDEYCFSNKYDIVNINKNYDGLDFGVQVEKKIK